MNRQLNTIRIRKMLNRMKVNNKLVIRLYNNALVLLPFFKAFLPVDNVKDSKVKDGNDERKYICLKDEFIKTPIAITHFNQSGIIVFLPHNGQNNAILKKSKDNWNLYPNKPLFDVAETSSFWCMN